YETMNDGVDLIPAGQKGVFVGADGLRNIAMNIAVTGMTEGNEPGTRESRCHRALGLIEKRGNGGDRHADVMLDRAAFEALSIRQEFAKLPEVGALFER